MDLGAALAPHVSPEAIPGLVALVGRGDEVVDVAVLGTVERDAIFRIASHR